MPDITTQVLAIFKQHHAILEDDHFVYASGDHGSGWINKDAIFPHTDAICQLAKWLSDAILNTDIHFDLICGPVTGGVVLSQWLGHHLKKPAIYADKHSVINASGIRQTTFILKRGYDKLVQDKQVLLVDDIINTGHSVLKVKEAITQAGGRVDTIATLINRANVYANDFNTRHFIYLLDYKIPAWPAKSCPLCQQNKPINIEHAYGAAYLAEQQGF